MVHFAFKNIVQVEFFLFLFLWLYSPKRILDWFQQSIAHLVCDTNYLKSFKVDYYTANFQRESSFYRHDFQKNFWSGNLFLKWIYIVDRLSVLVVNCLVMYGDFYNNSLYWDIQWYFVLLFFYIKKCNIQSKMVPHLAVVSWWFAWGIIIHLQVYLRIVCGLLYKLTVNLCINNPPISYYYSIRCFMRVFFSAWCDLLLL